MNKLEIKKEANGDILTVFPIGKIDTMTASYLEDDAKKSVEDIKHLFIDFKDVAYISSAGLRVIVAVSKLMKAKGGTFAIRNLSEDVYKIFKAVGLIDIISIE